MFWITVFTLVAIYLSGGANQLQNALVGIEKPVKEVVENRDTRKQAITLSKELGTSINKTNKDIDDLRAQLLDSLRDYHADVATLDPILEQLRAKRNVKREANLDTRDAMKELLTEEEWEKIFAETSD